MTNEEKLAKLEVLEALNWEAIDLKELTENFAFLDIIERCQRIRANLKGQFTPNIWSSTYSMPFTVTGTNKSTHEWKDDKWVLVSESVNRRSEEDGN